MTNITEKVIIIKLSNDNGIISSLDPSTITGVTLNLNNNKSIDINLNQIEKTNEGTLSEEVCISTNKRRKTDLTCVICHDYASGYNFNRISCNSCKEFFRRTAFQSLDKIPCINKNKSRCNIRFDIKHKCKHCRLLKCLESGMRKDFIMTSEQKLLKQKTIEQNRLIRSINTNYQSSIVLTTADKSCLTHINDVYSSTLKCNLYDSSMFLEEFSDDNISISTSVCKLLNTGQSATMNFIKFIRSITEFGLLNEKDRLTLVKFNLNFLYPIHDSLVFDSNTELWYDSHDKINSMSSSDQILAKRAKNLYIICFGYELMQECMTINHTFIKLIDNDPMIIQLLMIIIIFLKGLSLDEDPSSILIDTKKVLYIQLKYIDLLIRYLLQRISFNNCVIKILHFVEQILKLQKLSQKFLNVFRTKVDFSNIDPLMKTFLHLT